MGHQVESGLRPSARGSSIEILSIPCHFYVEKYSLIEDLFVPLLSSAQEASDLMGVRVNGEAASLRAAAYMAGELLRDVSISPGHRAMSASTIYEMDFVTDTFQADANIFGKGPAGPAVFRVQVRGKIKGDRFDVFDLISKGKLFSFTRFEAEKADYFSKEFPFLVHETRKNPPFAEGNSALVQGVVDLTLGIPVNGSVFNVRILKAQDTLSVRVATASTHLTIMELPLGSLGNLVNMTETISRYLSENQRARSLAESGSIPPDSPAAAVAAAEN